MAYKFNKKVIPPSDYKKFHRLLVDHGVTDIVQSSGGKEFISREDIQENLINNKIITKIPNKDMRIGLVNFMTTTKDKNLVIRE